MKLAVLISGRGSNLQSLIDACRQPDFPAEIAVVVSNRPQAAGLERARRAGIKAEIVDHTAFATRDAFDDALSACVAKAGADLVCLAGFMRLLGDKFVDRWRDRVINIHPSLLPAFRGLDVHQRVIDAGVRVSGCTVHFVRSSVDDGPIVIQAAVPVLPGDTANVLAARVLAVEHRIYPAAVRMIASGQARIDGGKVVISGRVEAASPLINPLTDEG